MVGAPRRWGVLTLGLGWAACSGESMIQLPRVGWSCENGASPDCIIVVVVGHAFTRSHVYDHTAARCEVAETNSHELNTCVMSSSGTCVLPKPSTPNALKASTSLHDRGNVDQKKPCNCGNSSVFCTDCTPCNWELLELVVASSQEHQPQHRSLHNNGRVNNLPKTAPEESRRFAAQFAL